MLIRFAVVIGTGAALSCTPAVALDAPQLPATAKKLTGPEIKALYDGASVSFNNFTQKVALTGTDTYDLGKNTHAGTFSIGGKTGTFKGSIRIKGDLFCHKEGSGKERCASVYTDGADIYEVNAKGTVESMNKKQ